MRLRPVERRDIEWLVDMAADPHLIGEHNWAGVPFDRARRKAEMTERYELDAMLSPRSGTMIVILDDGEPIGDVSWRTQRWGPSERSRCLVFGIALLPDHRAKGHGTEAQRLLVDHLFTTTDVHRIQSDTARDNPAEQRALEKIGMVREGVVRGAEWRGGSYHDHILYGILRTDWEAASSGPPVT
jgi:RimJ/RimL family protein N-acetyltransferase